MLFTSVTRLHQYVMSEIHIDCSTVDKSKKSNWILQLSPVMTKKQEKLITKYEKQALIIQDILLELKIHALKESRSSLALQSEQRSSIRKL